MTHDELLKYLNERLSWENGTETGNAYSALLTIVELHKPEPLDERGDVCLACCPDLLTPYPCPTIQAIEKELA